MVVYFSGTGNSRYCAQALAAKLDDRLINSAEYIKNEFAADLSSDKPWVFVSPVYGWRIPHIFADFIRSGNFSGNKNAYFVITCGSDIGSAANYLQPLCSEKGLSLRGALEVVMPENYLAMFPVPDEVRSKELIAAARPIIENAASLITEGKPFPKRGHRLFDNAKSKTVNSLFYKLFVKASPFWTTDKCVGCGRCAELCPLNNITLKNGRPIWGDNCTHCMACICRCHAQAVEYGKKSLGKRRYLCPEYKEDAK